MIYGLRRKKEYAKWIYYLLTKYASVGIANTLKRQGTSIESVQNNYQPRLHSAAMRLVWPHPDETQSNSQKSVFFELQNSF